MKKQTASLPKSVFLWKTPAYFVPLTFVVTLSLSYLLFAKTDKSASKNSEIPVAPFVYQETNDCEISQVRLKNYKLVQPLVLADVGGESDELQPVKDLVENFIEKKKQEGDIISASIYLRKLNAGEWVYVNETEKYAPASLLKVPLLMTYLKLAEQDPTLLDRVVLNNAPPHVTTRQTYSEYSTERGKKYTIRHLLESAVVFSDNQATAVLNVMIKPEQFDKVYTDLGLPAPPHYDLMYGMSASDYSRFYRALFNASYLNEKNSEYALSLLVKSSFKEGMTEQLPSTLTVAHKFGERNDLKSGVRQLHESGIVYINNEHPYLLTIMTKGRKTDTLAQTISDISALIYEYMNKHS